MINEVDTTATPACAIVIVCLNNRKYLQPCLRSLFDSAANNSFEVVVIDNGSTDGGPEMVRAFYPEVQLIQNGANLGLGRASNQGIEATRAPYILLLNDDTLVNGESLDLLVDYMRSTPDAGAVGGTLLNPDGSIQSGYNNFPTLWEEFLIATRLGEAIRPWYPSRPGGSETQAVDWMSSACLLLRREALLKTGFLDEAYFIYGDEADLQFRLAKAGWRMYHVPDSVTIHFGGRSMNRWRRRRMVYRGKMMFFLKSYGAFWTYILRGMLAGLTLLKVATWAVLWPFPPLRDRSQRELASNIDVLRLCITLE